MAKKTAPPKATAATKASPATKAAAKPKPAGARKKVSVSASAARRAPAAKPATKPTRSVASAPASDAPRTSSADASAAVDDLMESLAHPHKAAIEHLRRLILGLDPRVAEGVKWNAPSFRTREHFATVHLRSKRGLGLILHFGAKTRALPRGGLKISDPGCLLQWLASDRALIEFSGLDELKQHQRELEALLRRWLAYV